MQSITGGKIDKGFGSDQSSDLYCMDRKIPCLCVLFILLFNEIQYCSVASIVPRIGTGIAGFKVPHCTEGI